MNRREQIREMGKQRLDVCKSCPVYNETFQTCGKPLSKLNPFNEVVTIDNKQFSPCGCFLPSKVQLTLWTCPADKWQPAVEKSLWEDIKSFLFQPSIKSEQKQRLKELYLFATGTDVSREIDSCGSCGAHYVLNLRKQFADIPEATEIIDQIEEKLNVELKDNESVSDTAPANNTGLQNISTAPIPKKKRATKSRKSNN